MTMGTTHTPRATLAFKATVQEYSFYDKLVLQHAHPTKLLFDGVGVMWALYYAWNNNWQMALLMALAFGLFGSVLIGFENVARFAETKRGQFFLTMNNPISVAADLIGYCVLFYAVWIHDATLSICAASVFGLSLSFTSYRYFGR